LKNRTIHKEIVPYAEGMFVFSALFFCVWTLCYFKLLWY